MLHVQQIHNFLEFVTPLLLEIRSHVIIVAVLDTLLVTVVFLSKGKRQCEESGFRSRVWPEVHLEEVSEHQDWAGALYEC